MLLRRDSPAHEFTYSSHVSLKSVKRKWPNRRMRGISYQSTCSFGRFLPWSDVAENFIGSLFPPLPIPLASFIQIRLYPNPAVFRLILTSTGSSQVGKSFPFRPWNFYIKNLYRLSRNCIFPGGKLCFESPCTLTAMNTVELFPSSASDTQHSASVCSPDLFSFVNSSVPSQRNELQ